MARILSAGFLCVNFIAAYLPAIPGPSEIVYAPAGIRVRLSGHPANVSVDLMQLGARRGDVGIACAVGDDVFREFASGVLLLMSARGFPNDSGPRWTSYANQARFSQKRGR